MLRVMGMLMLLSTGLSNTGCRQPDETAPPDHERDPGVLEGAVTVRIDDAGIAHVSASNASDMFWAQGYFTARDRLWQMDFLRRQARGELAEILGESYLDKDILMRGLHFGAWGDEAAEAIAATDPEISGFATAYAAGVNQYLEDATAGRFGLSLSPQIEALDYVPAPWTPGDSHAVEKLITGGLSMRPDVDLIIGLLHITFRDRFFTDVYRFQGLDTTSIVPDYYAGRRHAPPAEEGDGRQRIQDMLSNLGREDAVAIARLARKLRLGNGGSNSFVVAGTHTESGHTLIASDTHLDTEHPSAYYYMHLETTSEGGDFNAIGATFPGAPFILFGHTESTAWLPTRRCRH